MNHTGAYWGWSALFLLGAYHGVNPGMGWLFAVALGMQEKSARAVARALPPIALGHALAIGAVVSLAALIEFVLPLNYVKIGVAVVLLALGLYRIRRSRHPRGAGMQVGFRDLTVWSFLMASAHGAGLMVLPVVMGMSSPAAMHHTHVHDMHLPVSSFADPLTGLWVTLVHTLGYLAVTAALAFLVYQKLGLALLRNAWFNLDLIWAIALIATGCLALIV